MEQARVECVGSGDWDDESRRGGGVVAVAQYVLERDGYGDLAFEGWSVICREWAIAHGLGEKVVVEVSKEPLPGFTLLRKLPPEYRGFLIYKPFLYGDERIENTFSRLGELVPEVCYVRFG